MKKYKGLLQKMCATSLVTILSLSSFSLQSVMADSFLLQGSNSEAIYAEWQGSGDYNAYYKASGDTAYTAVDSQLVRKDGNGGYRLDILGVKGNTEYEVKLVPVADGVENEAGALTFNQTPKAYDRSGFAHFNYNEGVGAYNNDGTPESGAYVVYVSESNKNSVSVNGRTGLSNILSKGSEFSKPLIIRILGKITSPSGVSTGMINIKSFTNGLTIEGVGTDACIYGWGFNISDNSDLEFRNVRYSWNYEDALGFQKSSRIWIHDNDFTVGNQTPPSESDKANGDGSCDIKRCDYVTVSYNHFIGTDKTSLVGSSASSVEDRGNLTFHHNLFDGTNQRTPRTRWHNFHVYNNYYKNAGYDLETGEPVGYGIGATCEASIFAENNYFENTYRPMITSGQGNENGSLSSNNGGAIKAFGNIIDNCTAYIPGTDYFEATSQKQVLTASDFTAVKGGYTYNNFDTGSNFYTDNYVLETAEQAKATAEAEAGILTATTFSSLVNDAGDGSGSSGGGSGDSGSDNDNNDDNNDDNTGGTGSGDSVATIAAQYYFDFPTSGSVATEFGGENGVGTYFTCDRTMSCSSTSGTITVGSETYNYTGVGGFGNNSKITFTTTDKAIFTIVSTSGSTTARKMVLTDASGAQVATLYSGTSNNTGVESITIEAAGTYTLTNKGGGEAKLFFIGVDEEKADVTESSTETTTSTTSSETTTSTESSTETTSETTTVTESSSETTTSTESSTDSDSPKDYLLGDADGNGVLEANDAANVLQKVLVDTFVLGIEAVVGEDYMKIVDVTGDNVLGADDAAAILQKVLNAGFVFSAEGK